MASINKTNQYFRISCGIGFLLSCYALFVEHKVTEFPQYEAYCDLHEHISCTKAFSSSYGRGFGIVGSILGKDSLLNQPNSVAGVIFYLLLIFISFSNKRIVLMLQIVFCIASNFMSLYMAYILYFILYDFCIVCVGTYVVNAINLTLSISKWNRTKGSHVLQKQNPRAKPIHKTD